MKSVGQTTSGFYQHYLEPEYASGVDKFDNRAWLLARLDGLTGLENSKGKAGAVEIEPAVNPAAELFREGYLALAGN
jgi:hypothetical protein